MNDQYLLNSRMVRAYLEEGDRKHSHLVKELGVSDSTVCRMLGGYVPRKEVIERLALLIGCKPEALLLPKTAKAG